MISGNQPPIHRRDRARPPAHHAARGADVDAVPTRRRPSDAPDVNPDRPARPSAAASSRLSLVRQRGVGVMPPPRAIEYSQPIQQWLDFLARLLAQTAWAERATAERT